VTAGWVGDDAVGSAEFSSDGRLLVVTRGKEACVLEAATGRPVGDPLPHAANVEEATFSPAGDRFLTVAGNDVRLWAARGGAGAVLAHDAPVRRAWFSPDGRQVVSITGRPGWGLLNFVEGPVPPELAGQNVARLRVWDVATGKPVGPPLPHDAA